MSIVAPLWSLMSDGVLAMVNADTTSSPVMFDDSTFSGVELVHVGGRSRVWRGVRVADGLPVVVKVARATGAGGAWSASRVEYDFGRRVVSEFVCSPVDLVVQADRPALVFPSSGGVSLDRLLRPGECLGISEVLDVGLAVARGLAAVHLAGLIHKDVNPSNIVINRGTGSVQLIDFGISTGLAAESFDSQIGRYLRGTLAYMAPEQTGRTSRPLDARGDLYSLGATLYRLLVGEAPFVFEDRLTIVHAHLARTPVAPCVRDPRIPVVLSDVVMALLAKDPHDRYQTADGLIADLERIRNDYRAGAVAAFTLRAHDVPDVLALPQRLYGRTEQLGLVMSAFERARVGESAVVFVNGAPGSGKTALIDAVYGPIGDRGGLWGAGKYDQLKSNAPYNAIIDACREALRDLPAGSEDEKARVASEIMAAVGDDGGVVAEVIPEIELLCGPQGEYAELGSAETRIRFARVFVEFVAALGAPGRPLVLFLDDLQWADDASISLLNALLGDQSSAVLIIGAYRDTEVHSTHPLRTVLETVAVTDSAVSIHLGPLGAADVDALVADSLRRDVPEGIELGALVMERTGANPFFVREFLTMLNRKNLVTADPDRAGSWRYDLEAIAREGFTNNVAESVAQRLGALPASTVGALSVGACIGASFTLDRVADLLDVAPLAAWEVLSPAVTDGVIRASNPEMISGAGTDVAVVYQQFGFLHDRVQEVAHDLLDEAERARVHLSLGRSMRINVQEPGLFGVVGHFDHARSIVDDPTESVEIAELYLRAAAYAEKAGAPDTALATLQAALSWLPQDCWERTYSLTFEIHKHLAGLYQYRNDIEASDGVIGAAMAHAADGFDRASLLRYSALSRTVQGDYGGALAIVCEALGMIGWDVPDDVAAALPTLMAGVHDDLKIWDASRMLALQPVSDPRAELATQIWSTMAAALFYGDMDMWAFSAVVGWRIALDYGPTQDTVFTLGALAISLWVYNHDLGDTKAVHDMALALWANRDVSTVSAGPHIFATYAHHYVAPADEVALLLRRVVRLSIQLADTFMGGWARASQPGADKLRGAPLSQVAQLAREATDFTLETGNDLARAFASVATMYATEMRGISVGETSAMSADEVEETLTIVGAGGCLHALQMEQWFILRDIGGAFDAAELVAEQDRRDPGKLVGVRCADHEFFRCLVYCACASSETDPGKREGFIGDTKDLRTRLATFAQYCPSTWLHRLELVDAELARAYGENYAALQHYEKAIALAREQESLQIEALACELSGRFLMAEGLSEIAHRRLRDSHELYQRWEAFVKVDQLESEFPFLSIRIPVQAGPNASARSSSGTGTTGSDLSVDVLALVRATQAITKAIDVEDMAREILNLAAHDAGADAALLILEDVDLVAVAQSVESGGVTVSRLGSGDRWREAAPFVSVAVVEEVRSTGKVVLIRDTANSLYRFESVQGVTPRSVLCVSLKSNERVCGVLYLQNSLAADAFSTESVEISTAICAQAVISMENAKLYADLAYQSLHDRLTSLPNWRFLGRRVSEVLAGTSHDHSAVGLILVELAKVQNVAQSLGWSAADEVVVQSARRLVAAVGINDSVARIQANTFAIVVEDLNSPDPIDTIGATAGRIRDQLNEPLSVAGKIVHIDARTGIACSKADTTADELLRQAQVALDQAEKAGIKSQNYDPRQSEAANQRLDMEHVLYQALEQDWFVTYFQPQIDLDTGRILGFEALIRIEHPTLGLIPPGAFIPVAESTGLILPIGRWIMADAVNQLATWQREFPNTFGDAHVSVNVSPHQLRDPNLVALVSSVLTDSGLNPEHLYLEITESNLMSDAEFSLKVLGQLCELGTKIWIDDFGTGYSSLAYLSRFPVHTLKIDRSFVTEINDGPDARGIVTAIIAMADVLGLEVIAEGIETPQQAQVLRDLGCHKSQGFYHARPQPAGQISKLAGRTLPI